MNKVMKLKDMKNMFLFHFFKGWRDQGRLPRHQQA